MTADGSGGVSAPTLTARSSLWTAISSIRVIKVVE
jgi:hypothetical protein